MPRRALVLLVLCAGCAPSASRSRSEVVEIPQARAPSPEPAPPLPQRREVDAGEILVLPEDTPTPDAEIRGQLHTMAQQARSCWRSHGAQLTIDMIVGVGGNVVEARVTGDDPRVNGCVHDVLIGWRFPEAPTASHVTATLRALAPSAATSPFDRGAAAAALALVNVRSCAQPGGPVGRGHVAVTFAPDGSVARTACRLPPFAATPVGACVEERFRRVRVPPFVGTEVTVGNSFVIP